MLGDLEVYGPDRVAALAVTHADCEALADRIRAELVAHKESSAARSWRGRAGPDPRPIRPGIGSCCTPMSISMMAAGSPTAASSPSRQVTPAGLAVIDGTGQVAHVPGRVRDRPGRRRPPAGVARLGSHHRRGPGRHLGPGPPAGHPGPGPLPRLCRANPARSPPPTPGTPPASPSTTATTADGWSANRRAPRPSRSPPPWPEPNPKPSPPSTTPTASTPTCGPNKTLHRAHLRRPSPRRQRPHRAGRRHRPGPPAGPGRLGATPGPLARPAGRHRRSARPDPQPPPPAPPGRPVTSTP